LTNFGLEIVMKLNEIFGIFCCVMLGNMYCIIYVNKDRFSEHGV